MGTIEYRSASSPVQLRRVSVVLWIGVLVLLFGSGPLIAVILAAKFGWTADPNPNPLLPGIMAMLTFWPGVGMVLIGAAITLVRWRERRAAAEHKPIEPR